MSPRNPLSMVKPRLGKAPLPVPCRLFRGAGGVEPSPTDVGVLLTDVPEFASVSAGRVTIEGDGIPTQVDLSASNFIRVRAGERTRIVVEEIGGDVRVIDVTLAGGPPRPLAYEDVPLTLSGDEAVDPKNDAAVFFVGFTSKVKGLRIDEERLNVEATDSDPAPSVALSPGPHAVEVDIEGVRHRLTVDLQPGELLDLTRTAFSRATVVETSAPPPVGPIPSGTPGVSPSPTPSTSPTARVTGDAQVFPSPPAARVTIGGVEVVGPAFRRTLAPGRYPVEVSAAGYGSKTVMIDVRSDTVSELRVELSPVVPQVRSRAPQVVLGIFAAVSLLAAAAAAVGAARADRSDPSTEW